MNLKSLVYLRVKDKFNCVSKSIRRTLSLLIWGYHLKTTNKRIIPVACKQHTVYFSHSKRWDVLGTGSFSPWRLSASWIMDDNFSAPVFLDMCWSQGGPYSLLNEGTNHTNKGFL